MGAMIVSIAERIADLLFELDVIGAVESFNGMTENAEIKVNATALLVDALGKSGDRVDNAMVAIIGWVDPFYADDPNVMGAVRVGIIEILAQSEWELVRDAITAENEQTAEDRLLQSALTPAK